MSWFMWRLVDGAAYYVLASIVSAFLYGIYSPLGEENIRIAVTLTAAGVVVVILLARLFIRRFPWPVIRNVLD